MKCFNKKLVLVSIFVFTWTLLPAPGLSFTELPGIEGSTEEVFPEATSEGADLLPLSSHKVVDLQGCVQLALRNRAPEWYYQVEAQKGAVLESAFSFIPRIDVEAVLGPAPSDADFFDFGVLNYFKVQAGIPLYDFGRRHNYHQAALRRVQVEKNSVELMEIHEVLDVIRLYYGVVFGRETLNVLYDAREKVYRYRDQIEAKYKKRPGDVSRADVLAMRLDVLKLENQIAEAEEKGANAFDALALKIGFDRGEKFDVEDRFLRPVKNPLKSLEDYHELAKLQRPELSMLEIGIEARKYALSAEKRSLLPAFFLGGFVENSSATSVQFDNDLNFTQGGVGLGLKWGFDWNQNRGKVKVARSEYMKLVEQQRMALPAIELDVTRAYREATRRQGSLRRGRKARKISRALMFFAKSNWDIGVGDPLKLKDALIRFNEARFQHLQAIFDFNVAMAKLNQSVGQKFLPVVN